MFIGQSVNKTMDKLDLAPSNEQSQLRTKIRLSREEEGIQGNCWWPGYSITANYKGVADSLASGQQSTIAICPSYPWISTAVPAAVADVKAKDGKITWAAGAVENKATDVVRYVVYRFADKKAIDLNNAAAIVAVVPDNEFTAKEKGVYVITALDRVNNESPASKPVEVK